MAEIKSLADFCELIEKGFLENCLVAQGEDCGLCMANCPVLLDPKFGLAHKGPNAVMKSVSDLLRGKSVSPEAYLWVFGCGGGCSNLCQGVCPSGIQPGALHIAVARRLYEANMGPPPSYQELLPGKYRYSAAHVLGDLVTKKTERPWLTLTEVPHDPDPVDVVLFNSCVSHKMPNVIMDAMDILTRMGVNFITVAGPELCCGAVPLRYGLVEEAQKLAETFVATMSAFRAKKVVTACPGCTIFSNGLLSMLFQVPFETQHITDFLADNTDNLNFTAKPKRVVTIHDACAQIKYSGCDSPRKMLQAIPGITLVEMKHNKENSICCGGLTNVHFPDTMKNLHKSRGDEAVAAGAEILTTVCPDCTSAFYHFEENYPLQVKHAVSVLAEAMGIHNEDKLKRYVLTRDIDKVLAEARDCIDASDLSPAEFEYVLRHCLGYF